MSLPTMLVRLCSVTPGQKGKRNYTILKRPGIPATSKFSEEVGWYRVPTAIAEVLRHEQDLAGKPVFDVLTQSEAAALEHAEAEKAAKKMIHHKAANPNVMHFQTGKSAADFAPDALAPRAPVKPTAKPAAATPVVTPSEIDWDSVGDSAPENEASEEADDEVVSYEAADLVTAPAEDNAVEREAPRKSGGRSGRKGK